jgi:hypothetical protein
MYRERVKSHAPEKHCKFSMDPYSFCKWLASLNRYLHCSRLPKFRIVTNISAGKLGSPDSSATGSKECSHH